MGKWWANRQKRCKKGLKKWKNRSAFFKLMTSHGQIPALNHGQIFLYLRNPMGKSWANFQIGQKNRSYRICNSLIFKSGQKDSNLRPPAPKAGALAGLRHTPKKRRCHHRLLCCGEGGIRTPGTLCRIRQFSKLLVSATHPPLLGCELRCKSRLFSVIHKHFLSLFLKKNRYLLNYSKICFE